MSYGKKNKYTIFETEAKYERTSDATSQKRENGSTDVTIIDSSI
jgi:hypothetical protein